MKARDEALVHSINHSTRRDGKPLSLYEVADLIERHETTSVSFQCILSAPLRQFGELVKIQVAGVLAVNK